MNNMLLPLSFLLLASTLTLLPEAVRASGNPVLDDKGIGLLPGVPYNIISSQWPIFGGTVSLGKDINDTCPVDVILLEKFCAPGTPVTFSIASGEGLFITDSTDLHISFDTTSNCTNESMVWMHESINGSTEFLTTGGVEGDVNTIFRIVNVGGSSIIGPNYKIVAYKLSSYGLTLSTSDVGAEFDFTTGIRRLALTEPALIVGFEVAYDGLKAVV